MTTEFPRLELFRLFSAIITSLRQIPTEVWEEIEKESALIRSLAFAMAVVQGCLVARQLFGSGGLSRWYPLGKSTNVFFGHWSIVR